jgi:hypothetical protein
MQATCDASGQRQLAYFPVELLHYPVELRYPVYPTAGPDFLELRTGHRDQIPDSGFRRPHAFP